MTFGWSTADIRTGTVLTILQMVISSPEKRNSVVSETIHSGNHGITLIDSM